MQLEFGDLVRFIGAADEQVAWGGNDDPRKVCEVGKTYRVSGVEVHQWHTKVWLDGLLGRFNSVSFEYVAKPSDVTISQLVKDSYDISKAHGFWDDAATVPQKYLISTKLALIHSEVSEALEEVRVLDKLTETRYNGDKPEGFPSELADAVIRIADICGRLGIDLESVIVEKQAFNRTRPYRHGRKL